MPSKRLLFSLVPILIAVIAAMLLIFYVPADGDLISSRNDNGQSASRIKSQAESLKARTNANNAHMAELIVRLNTHAINCETAKESDDPSQLESIRACHELNQKEEDAILMDTAASVKETSAIRGALDAVQKDLDALAIKSSK